MNPIRKESNFDIIQKSLVEGTTGNLTSLQQDLLKRWVMAHDLMLDGKLDKEIITMLKDRFEISSSLAYKDLSDARRIFGKANILDKSHLFYTLYQLSLEALKDAIEAKDAKTRVTVLKIILGIATELKDSGIDAMAIFNQYNIQIVASAESAGLEVADTIDVKKLLDEIEREHGITEAGCKHQFVF